MTPIRTLRVRPRCPLPPRLSQRLPRRAPRGLALALLAAGAVALGCGWPRTADERAAWFWERGEEWIVTALEDVEAADDQIEDARAVIAAHEPRVLPALETLFARHREVLRTLAGGASTDTLLASEEEYHEAHRLAIERVGAMHEDLAETLGRPTWERARQRMQERADEHLAE